MWPNWFGLLGGFSSVVSIVFYLENHSLLVIQQAKSVSPYSVTVTTIAHVVIGMDGHVITVICSCLVIPDMGGGVVNVSSCLILIDV